MQIVLRIARPLVHYIIITSDYRSQPGTDNEYFDLLREPEPLVALEVLKRLIAGQASVLGLAGSSAKLGDELRVGRSTAGTGNRVVLEEAYRALGRILWRGNAVLLQLALAVGGHPVGGPGGRKLLVDADGPDAVTSEHHADLHGDNVHSRTTRIGGSNDYVNLALFTYMDFTHDTQVQYIEDRNFRVGHVGEPAPDCLLCSGGGCHISKVTAAGACCGVKARCPL